MSTDRFKQFYPYKKVESILYNCEIKFIDNGIELIMQGNGFDIQSNTFYKCKAIELDNGVRLLKEK